MSLWKEKRQSKISADAQRALASKRQCETEMEYSDQEEGPQEKKKKDGRVGRMASVIEVPSTSKK